jgi:hypothetical protein
MLNTSGHSSTDPVDTGELTFAKAGEKVVVHAETYQGWWSYKDAVRDYGNIGMRLTQEGERYTPSGLAYDTQTISPAAFIVMSLRKTNKAQCMPTDTQPYKRTHRAPTRVELNSTLKFTTSTCLQGSTWLHKRIPISATIGWSG